MPKTALELYESPECQDLFKRAWDLFPDYNNDQADEAADWILDNLVPIVDDEGNDLGGLDDDEQTELYEMIIAGLT